MTTESKMLTGIGLLSIFIVFGAYFFVGKSSPDSTAMQSVPASQTELVRSDSYKKETKNAKVTLVEFLDFQCEACRAAYPQVQSILKEYDGKVTFVVRYFPLPGHKNSMIAAQAAEAAGEQGKFWEMKDKLFTNQPEWAGELSPVSQEEAIGKFVVYAKELGLNEEKFSNAMKSDKILQKINRDKQDGTTLGVQATPTFFVNGQKTMMGGLKTVINAELAK